MCNSADRCAATPAVKISNKIVHQHRRQGGPVRLLLLRHAETTSNVAGALDTAHPGADLTDWGAEQARQVVTKLAHEPVAAIGASPLTRARRTAEPIAAARGLPVEVLDGLREVSAGDLEMRRDPSAIEAYINVLTAWLGGDLDVAMPGALTGAAFLARFDDAVSRLESAADVALAVSHGAAIRLWVALRCVDAAPTGTPGVVSGASANGADGADGADGANGADGADGAARDGLANTGLMVVEGSSASGWRLVDWADGAPAEAAPTGTRRLDGVSR
jgi:broad specificity phosphatase PhoE